MIRKTSLIVAGVLWGILVFLVGIRIFFPSDPVLQRVQYELGKRSDQKWALGASSVAPWRGTGLEFEDFKLISLGAPTPTRNQEDPDAPEAAPTGSVWLSADNMGLRLRLLDLLLGRIAIGFVADLYDGGMDGHLGFGDKTTVVDFQLSDIDLSQMPIDGDSIKLQLGGVLEGMADLTIDSGELEKSEGSLSFEVKDLLLKAGSIGGFDLPGDQKFTEARFAFEVKGGKLTITAARLTGDLGDGTFEGEITFNKKLSRSRVRVQLTLTLAESFDRLVQIVPTGREARDDKGVYHFVVSGTLDHPRMRPDRAVLAPKTPRAGAAAGAPGTSPKRRLGAEDEPGLDAPMRDDPDAAAASEDRRKSREDRIKERRERLRKRREEAGGSRGEAEEPVQAEPEEDPLPPDEPDIRDEPYEPPVEDDVPMNDEEMGEE